jgi:hypothetical protein
MNTGWESNTKLLIGAFQITNLEALVEEEEAEAEMLKANKKMHAIVNFIILLLLMIRIILKEFMLSIVVATSHSLTF